MVDAVTINTIRIDTFLRLANLTTVDYLKIDAQGMELQVLESAGDRLRDIHRICVECYVANPLYRDCPTKEDVLAFFENQNFTLIDVLTQGGGIEENLTFENTALDSRWNRLPIGMDGFGCRPKS